MMMMVMTDNDDDDGVGGESMAVLYLLTLAAGPSLWPSI